MTYRDELEADVDVEEFYDRLFGRSPFRPTEDHWPADEVWWAEGDNDRA